jgi:cysteine desulfurase
MPGRTADVQVMAFDLAGIAVSAGAACSSGKVAASHVLAAMGIADEEAKRAIRVSLGWRTTSADIDRLLAAWRDIEAGCGRRPNAA